MNSVKSKNIAIVIDSLAGGGAEKVMLDLSQSLLAQGHNVTLLVLQKKCDYTPPASINIDYIFSETDSKFDSFWRISNSVNRLKQWFHNSVEFDLVLSNLDKSNLLLSKIDIKNLYMVVHNAVAAELNRERKISLFAYWRKKRAKKALDAQQLITVSKGIKDEINQIDWINPKSIKCIYNIYNIDQIIDKSNQAFDKPDEPYIIHVGRMAKQKRHDVLFEALSKTQTDLKLVLLCRNTKKALKLARKYDIADRLILPGFTQNPYPWIKHAELMVLSSEFEGLGGVLIESLILKTKVVSTDCPHGPNEILTGELAKYLSPVGDPQALANNIDKSLGEPFNFDEATILKQVAPEAVSKYYLSLINN